MGRRARRVLAAALSVTLAVMLWFLLATRDAGEGAVNLLRGLGSAAPAAAPAGAQWTQADSVASQTPSVHGDDEIELCGGLWVKATPEGLADEDDLRRVTRLPELRGRLIDELGSGSSEFARAAAIWLRLAEGATARDSLARMASTTRDPLVYSLAFNTCGQLRAAEGACQLLNPEQWAKLDPDNATPWLYVLSQAAQRRDTATQSEALFRISTSKLSDQHFFALPGLVLEHMPGDDATMPGALTLASEAIGVVAAWSLPGYEVLYDLCKASALRDANRRQTCGAVAELLVEHSDTLLERSVGITLGKRLAWPDERVERLRGEQAAYMESFGTLAAVTPSSGCDDLRRDMEIMKRHARLGEAGALRDWVGRSGKRPDEFIRAERDLRSRMAAAASAASAASAPG